MKHTVDELTRLAFLYAEQDRESTGTPEGAELAAQFKAYRLKHWGRTAFEEAMEAAKSISIPEVNQAPVADNIVVSNIEAAEVRKFVKQYPRDNRRLHKETPEQWAHRLTGAMLRGWSFMGYDGAWFKQQCKFTLEVLKDEKLV